MTQTTRPGWWTWLSGLFGKSSEPADAVPPHLRKPFIRRRWRTIELQFAHGVSQSQMVSSDPDRLLIDYTRTMLGALVLMPQPRRIGMIGLGGGSQAKYCYRHLQRSQIEVVENNPHVLALRREFRIPDDDGRFQVFLDDGAHFLQQRPGSYDLLLVDGYDETGIPPALSTQQFYDDCRAALGDRGAMAVNLYCADAQSHIDKLRNSFGARRVLVMEEARQSNRVALAWVGPRPHHGEAIGVSQAARQDLAAVFQQVRSLLSD